jgi:hypothetical protein
VNTNFFWISSIFTFFKSHIQSKSHYQVTWSIASSLLLHIALRMVQSSFGTFLFLCYNVTRDIFDLHITSNNRPIVTTRHHPWTIKFAYPRSWCLFTFLCFTPSVEGLLWKGCHGLHLNFLITDKSYNRITRPYGTSATPCLFQRDLKTFKNSTSFIWLWTRV